jgi:hypothetical protein
MLAFHGDRGGGFCVAVASAVPSIAINEQLPCLTTGIGDDNFEELPKACLWVASGESDNQIALMESAFSRRWVALRCEDAGGSKMPVTVSLWINRRTGSM